MNSELHARASAVFLEVCDLPAAERAHRLDERCAADPALRRAVEHLLAFDRSDAVIDTPIAPASFIAPPEIPQRIGAFVIEGILGEGGMGVVYRARQEHPQRMVALKVVRPERATAEMLRRFEFEAHALARLHHPAIAQIYEAGSVDTGRGRQPYFALELVDGRPLPMHADDAALDVAERLELLARVADGVHHAHLKGVIHRDLKPGNVMVDADGQPKILDFGVARISDADVRTTALRTTAGQLLGTIAYMSPEQASGDPDAIDARSDVYALGVMAYELLAGRMPLDLDCRPLPEASRAICEEEPKLLGNLDPALRGDVETIVATAMAKDRERRYASADAFASDVRRYLAHEPIHARPASALYQLRKFARRNRTLVASLVAIGVILTLGAAVSTLFAIEQGRAQRSATRAAERADTVRDFFMRVLVAAAPENAGPQVTVVEALHRAQSDIESSHEDLPEVRADVHEALARTFHQLAMPEDAERHARAALDLRRSLPGTTAADLVRVHAVLAMVRLGRQGDQAAWDEADQLLDQASSMTGDSTELEALVVGQQAMLAFRRGDDARAERLVRESMALSLAVHGPGSAPVITARQNLAVLLMQRGDHVEAARQLEVLLPERRRTHGDRHPETLLLRRQLAAAYRGAERFESAESIYRELLPLEEEIAGSEHDATVAVVNDLAFTLKAQGRLDEAAELYADALDRVRRGATPNGFMTVVLTDSLALTRARQLRFDEAAELHAECVERLTRDFPLATGAMANARFKHVCASIGSGRLVEARDLVERYLEDTRVAFDEPSREVTNLRAAAARIALARAERDVVPRIDECLAAYRDAELDWVAEWSIELLAESCDDAGETDRASRLRALLEVSET